jgi:hypothetical protein
MKTLIVAVLALGLAACGGQSGDTRHNVDEPDAVQNVDECPRADGQPCR